MRSLCWFVVGFAMAALLCAASFFAYKAYPDAFPFQLPCAAHCGDGKVCKGGENGQCACDWCECNGCTCTRCPGESGGVRDALRRSKTGRVTPKTN